MKTNIRIIALTVIYILLIAECRSQSNRIYNRNLKHYQFVSIGIDARNAIIGSEPTENKPALDLNFKAGVQSGVAEVSVFYETFKRIDFQAYGLNLNVVSETVYENLTIASGIEFGSINRAINSNYLMVGINIEPRYKITEHLSVGALFNYRLRNDLKRKKTDDLVFRKSGFINVYYTF